MMNKKGLYIHIPFCHKICTYCDFPKRVSCKENITKYIDSLVREFDLYLSKGFDFKKINTIYIGGGTPSSLEIRLLRKILNKIESVVDDENIVEYTFEINPEDLNKELIDLLSSYNINRVSIGIQSLNKNILKFLNRDFDYDQFIENYNYLKRKINNINFDLMYAIPTQTKDDLEKTLKSLIELKPTHFSIYSLILEEKTIINYLVKKGQIQLVSEELELEMVDTINKLLFPIYKHYEVSNYALKNFQSKHNLLYWNNQEYLGLGLGAASYLDNKRFANTQNLQDYFASIEKQKLPIDEIEILTLEDKKKYHLMLGFRLIDGFDYKQYQSIYNSEIFYDFPLIKDFIKKGYVELFNNKIRIHPDYLYVMNHLLKQLM